MNPIGLRSCSSTEKVEIYYPKTAPCTNSDATHSPGKDSLLVKVSPIVTIAPLGNPNLTTFVLCLIVAG